MAKEEEFEIFGYSTGDWSVGIPSVEFCLKTGIYLDEQDKVLFQEKSVDREKVLEILKRRLYEHKPWDDKISYIDLIHIMVKDIMYELHDNGKIISYDNIINGEF
jgi:hypothetical protein